MSSLDNKTWKIIFKGEVLPGLNRDVVQKDCIHLLKLPPEKVSRMFSGRKITLRKNLSQERLERYATFFQRCGMRVHIVEEKDDLKLMADESAAAAAAQATPVLSSLLPPEQDNNDEIFAQQTIVSPFLGHDNFYDALIRKDGSEDADFHARSFSISRSVDSSTAQHKAQSKHIRHSKKQQPASNNIVLVGGVIAVSILVTLIYLLVF